MAQLFDRLKRFIQSEFSSSRGSGSRLNTELDDILRELEGNPRHDNQRHDNQRHQQAKQQRPEESMPNAVRDAHMALSVPVGSTADAVKKAYRKAIAQWHPDKFATATAEQQRRALEQTQRLNSAYQTLQDYYGYSL
jgi:DnaJ-domain-containing protein 1